MPKSRAAIIEAAFDVFSADPTASLADVAEAAGVGRATLHRHFAGRDDLMAELAQIALDELDAAVDEATKDATSYAEGLRLALQVMIPLGSRQWFLAHEPVERHPDVARAYEESRQELIDDLRAAQDEGVFDPLIPVSWLVQAYEALIFAGWESVREGELTPRQAADLAWRNLTQGLAPKS